MADKKKNVTVIEPDFSLKNKIRGGTSVKTMVTEDVIEEAREVVESQKVGYENEALVDVDLLQGVYDALKRQQGDPKRAVKELKTIVLRLKGNAAIFDYPLATEVADCLYKYLTKLPSVGDKKALIIIKAHLDALLFIFSNNIKGSKHAAAEELIKELRGILKSLE